MWCVCDRVRGRSAPPRVSIDEWVGIKARVGVRAALRVGVWAWLQVCPGKGLIVEGFDIALVL